MSYHFNFVVYRSIKNDVYKTLQRNGWCWKLGIRMFPEIWHCPVIFFVEGFKTIFLCYVLIQKIFKRKKIAGTVLFISWLATHQRNFFFENCNSVGAGAFGPTLTPISLIIGECKKCKIYILKKVGLTTFK